jgi:hypothetical protein
VLRTDALDDIWTQHAQSALTRSDVDALSDVTAEINRGLNYVIGETGFLKRLLNARGAEIDQDALSAVQRLPLSTGVKRRYREHLDRQKGVTKLALKSIATLRTRGPDAAEELLGQMNQIRDSESPAGDMPKWAKCGLLGAGMGAATAAGNWPALAALIAKADDVNCFEI